MRNRAPLTMIGIVTVIVLLLSTAAMADTIIYAPTNLSASGTISTSGNTFSGSVTFSNGSSFDQLVAAFSLQLFGGNTTITQVNFSNLFAGWTPYISKQSN